MACATTGSSGCPMRSPPSPSACGRRVYATGAVVGSQVLDRRYGLAARIRFLRRPARRIASPAAPAGPSGAPTRWWTPRSRWPSRLGPRFFLWVHFYDPHMTYDPPAGFASAFSSRPYDGEIAFVDAQLGRLLEGLRARWGGGGAAGGRDERPRRELRRARRPRRTPIWSTRRRSASRCCSPVPGSRPAARVAAPVGLVDVAPTVLALARAQPLPETAGRDLSPLFARRAGRAGECVLRDGRPAARLRLEPAARAARRKPQVHPGPAAGALRSRGGPGRAAQSGGRAAGAGRVARRSARGEAARVAPRAPRHRSR